MVGKVDLEKVSGKYACSIEDQVLISHRPKWFYVHDEKNMDGDE